MTTVNTSAASATPVAAASAAMDKAKQLPVIYTRQGAKGIAVALWLSTITTPRAPKLIGRVGEVQVSGFVRQGPKGPFLDIVGAKQADGTSAPVATANIVINEFGIPKVAMRMQGQSETVFAEVSLSMPKESLIEFGMNAQTQAKKLSDAATRRAEKAAAKEAVPA